MDKKETKKTEIKKNEMIILEENEKRLMSHNRLLTFFLIILLIIVACVVGIMGGQYLGYKTLKTSIIKSNDKSSNNKCNTKTKIIEKEKEYLSGIYSYSDENINMKITFLETGLMEVETKTKDKVIELSEGTYDISENKLTYKRIYIATSINGNNYWSRNIDYDTLNLDKKEEFIVDKKEKTLKTVTYLRKTMNIDDEITLSLN